MKKLFKNIIFGFWMYFNLRHLHPFHDKIQSSREAGDFEKEREEILNSTRTWGNGIVKKYKIKLTITGLENVPEGAGAFCIKSSGLC